MPTTTTDEVVLPEGLTPSVMTALEGVALDRAIADLATTASVLLAVGFAVMLGGAVLRMAGSDRPWYQTLGVALVGPLLPMGMVWMGLWAQDAARERATEHAPELRRAETFVNLAVHERYDLQSASPEGGWSPADLHRVLAGDPVWMEVETPDGQQATWQLRVDRHEGIATLSDPPRRGGIWGALDGRPVDQTQPQEWLRTTEHEEG